MREHMTPEERNRTIDFIIQSQARLAAAQEQDRQDRLEFEKWARDQTLRIATLTEIESPNSCRDSRISELDRLTSDLGRAKAEVDR